jgi:acyl-coenzyme A thioesterase PaaI-like protein
MEGSHSPTGPLVAELRSWIEEHTPHNAALGMRLVSAEPGEVTCTLPDSGTSPDEDAGLTQSGALMALVDVACGGAVCMRLGRLPRIATLELRLDAVRSPRPGQRLTARAECLHVAGALAFVRGIAHDGDAEHPVCFIQASFMVGES